MSNPQTTTEPGSRVPLATRLFYGVGSVSEGTKNTAFNVFLLFYFNQVLGLSGIFSGAAIFVALCVDAITDPLVGSISDHTRSRWGRRHPYMYSAALPMAASFYLLFNPPAGLGQTGLFLWLAGFAVAVRTSMTLYAIPSSSMVPEITSHYDERTTLVAYRFLFGWVGGLSASLLGYQVFFRKVGDIDGRLIPESYQGFALACAAVIFLAILVCAAGTHRLIPTLRSPPKDGPLSLGGFVEDLRDAFSNRSYRNLVLGLLFASVAGGFNDVVGLYMNTYFWEFSTDQISLFVVCLAFAALFAFALARPISERFDKKQAAVGLALFAVIFGPLPVFLRLAGWMPANGTRVLLGLMLLHSVVLVFAVVVISILVASMVGDVVDENELSTGKRQEGLFVSAITFTQKATSGLGGLAAGIALDVIAFPRLADPGSVAPEKLFQLGFAVGPGMMVLFVLLVFFLSRYGITRERHRQILAELQRRREVAPPPPLLSGSP
ncbi:MAG: MFS transporter [Myxococcota bacterium]